VICRCSNSLTLIERHRSPGADERTEHQFQDRPLAERIRDDLEATAFLDEEAFKQIRRPDGPPMRHRAASFDSLGHS
jgi:hypothetical protein